MRKPPAAFSIASSAGQARLGAARRNPRPSTAQLANHIATVPAASRASRKTMCTKSIPPPSPRRSPKIRKDSPDAFEASVRNRRRNSSKAWRRGGRGGGGGGGGDHMATATWRPDEQMARKSSRCLASRLSHGTSCALTLVSPPRPTLRLPSPARGPRPLDLRPQRRRKPLRPSPLTSRSFVRPSIVSNVYGFVGAGFSPTSQPHQTRIRQGWVALCALRDPPRQESPLTTRYICDTIPLSLTSGEERHYLVRWPISLSPPFPQCQPNPPRQAHTCSKTHPIQPTETKHLPHSCFLYACNAPGINNFHTL